MKRLLVLILGAALAVGVSGCSKEPQSGSTATQGSGGETKSGTESGTAKEEGTSSSEGGAAEEENK